MTAYKLSVGSNQAQVVERFRLFWEWLDRKGGHVTGKSNRDLRDQMQKMYLKETGNILSHYVIRSTVQALENDGQLEVQYSEGRHPAFLALTDIRRKGPALVETESAPALDDDQSLSVIVEYFVGLDTSVREIAAEISNSLAKVLGAVNAHSQVINVHDQQLKTAIAKLTTFQAEMAAALKGDGETRRNLSGRLSQVERTLEQIASKLHVKPPTQ